MYNKVYVEITNICNKNCSFCHGHIRPPRQMDASEFAVILDKLADYTKYIYYHLMGEPLVHPQLAEFVRMATERGYKSIITTNGTLLHRCQDALLRAGVHKFNISLYSFEQGSAAELDAYVTPLAAFAKKAAAAGSIVVFRLWNKGYDNGKNELTLDVLRQNISGDWTPNTRGLRICDKIFVESGDRFEWPDKDAEIKGDKFFCYGLKDQFGILVDGTVVPCCLDSDGVINLGNVFADDLASILQSKRAQDMCDGFRCGRATEALCQRCGFAQRFSRRFL